MNRAIKATAHEIKIRRMAYFYSAAKPRSRGALWPIFAPALIAAWPYALLCAWTYLTDSEAAYDLMDHAVENTSRYIDRHPDSASNKLTSRIKSVIRRRAKQLAAKQSRELSYGSLLDLEQVYAGQPEAEQRVYANELLVNLSPFAQSIVNWRWLGYSWREIAVQFEMDHTAVRRAYFREWESVLHRLSRPGDFS